LLAAIYLVAGVLHVLTPAPFLSIMPAWVPAPEFTVLFTGLCEIAGAVGLIIPRTRKAAGMLLAAYAVCVFPANINHAWRDLAIEGSGMGWGYHGPRLLFQPVIVWWTLFAAGIVAWPLRSR